MKADKTIRNILFHLKKMFLSVAFAITAFSAGPLTLGCGHADAGSILADSDISGGGQVAVNIDVTPPITTARPPGGIYDSSQTVTLSTGEAATIYYTTNGSDPTTSSTRYSSPLTISSTLTLKYFAVDTAGNREQLTTSTYTIPRFGNITGSVTDSIANAGIQGVLVIAYDENPTAMPIAAITDRTGSYSITGLAAGSYKIIFRTYGNTDYQSQWYNNKPDKLTATTVTVTDSSTTTGINASLQRGGKITGTVSDNVSGSGISGIDVNALDTISGTWINSGYTDSSGTYSISGLTTGSYQLRFSGADYVAQWYGGKIDQTDATIVTVNAPNTTAGINMTMVKGGIITGIVTDSTTGAGVQNADVTVYDSVTGSWVGYDNTDDTGTYRIPNLASGNYTIRVSKNGFIQQWYGGAAEQTDASAITVTAPETTTDINVELAMGGGISGKVSDSSTGAAVAGVHLYIIDHSTGNWMGSAQTDSDGTYAITGLSSGSYRLRIEPAYDSEYLGVWYGGNDSGICSVTVTVTPPDITTGINVQLERGGRISGKVTDGATGIGIAGVTVSMANNSSQVVMPVLPAATPTPLHVSMANNSNQAVMPPQNIETDPSGAYTISGLTPGEYSLSFSAPGYVSTTLPSAAKITAAGTLTGIDATLTKGGGISGRVTDSRTGAGIPKIWVSAIPEQPGYSGGNVITDNNGNYIITGLASGKYAFNFSDMSENGYGNSWYTGHYLQPLNYQVSVSAPEITTGINMSLAKMGSITGVVTDSIDGNPLKWMSVTVYDIVTGHAVGNGTTNSDGIYRMGGLPGGNYRVRFSNGFSSGDGGYLPRWYGGGSDATTAKAVSVTPPETTGGIDATLSRAGGITGSIAINSCPGPKQVRIMPYDATTGNLAGQYTFSTSYEDSFTIIGLPAGSYKLLFIPVDSGFTQQWYPNKPDMSASEPVTVTAGSITDKIDVLLATGGAGISGRATTISGNPLHAQIKLYDWYSGNLVAETSTSYDGRYRLPGLPDGSYKLRLTVNDIDQWYQATGETDTASKVVVSGAVSVTGINLVARNRPGDIDGSGGRADLRDALKALRIAVGLDLVTPEILARGDVAPIINSIPAPDGRITIADVLVILHMVVDLAE